MHIKNILIALSMIFLAFAEPAFAECNETEKPVTDLGQRFGIGKELTTSNPTDSVSHFNPTSKARYLRFLIEAANLGTSPWYLTIRDEQSHPVQVLGREDFVNGGKRWSQRIPGDVAYFDLDTLGKPSPVTIEVEQYIAMPETAKNPYYSLQNPDSPTFKPLYKDGVQAVKRRLGDSVGFLMSSWDKASWCCSGVMIAPDLFLTNWHCGGGGAAAGLAEKYYWSQDVCDSTLIDLSWDDSGASNEYTCTKVEASVHDLDFAVLRIAPTASNARAKPIVIRAKTEELNEFVNIVHHPSCDRKQISEDCQITKADYPNWIAKTDMTDFSYQCDTEKGSSGAPVFDSNGLLIGLHHLGFASDNSCASTDKENKAIQIGRIVDFLRADPKYAPIVKELRIR